MGPEAKLLGIRTRTAKTVTEKLGSCLVAAWQALATETAFAFF